VSRNRSSISSLLRRDNPHRDLLLMIIPCVAFFVIFHYVPMYGAIIAFKNYRLADGVFGSEWSGLENFRRLFLGKDFPLVIRNTLTISALRLVFGFFAPIALALMLNEVRVGWYKRTIQTLTYLPYFISWVILGGIFLMFFSTDGPVNEAMTLGGAGKIDFLTNDFWFVTMIIVTGIWQSAGYGAVIYLAALAGIDPTLYEAASIDGASRWRQTLHVTLPCLVPTIITLFILNVGYILNAGFDQIYNMYNAQVYDSADIIDTYVLRRLTALDFSLATAAGLFKSVVGMIMLVVVNAVVRRTSDGEQGVW